MKPYFENEKCIVSFEKVINIDITKKNEITVFTGFYIYMTFPIEQLENYKRWLENQSPDAGKMVNNNNWQPTIEQVNEIGNIINAGCDCCQCENYHDGCNFKITQEKYQELLSKLKEMEN